MNGVEYYIGGERTEDRPLRQYSPEALAFVAELSAALMQSPAARVYPDMMGAGVLVPQVEPPEDAGDLSRGGNPAGTRALLPYCAGQRAHQFCIQLSFWRAGGVREHRPAAQPRIYADPPGVRRFERCPPQASGDTAEDGVCALSGRRRHHGAV